jgi:hypothetical protein
MQILSEKKFRERFFLIKELTMDLFFKRLQEYNPRRIKKTNSNIYIYINHVFSHIYFNFLAGLEIFYLLKKFFL